MFTYKYIHLYHRLYHTDMKFYRTASGYLYFRAFPRPMDECKFYIREKVEKRFWSVRSQKVLVGQKGADQINQIIRRVKDITENTIREAKISGTSVTSEMMGVILSTAIFGDKKQVIAARTPKAITLAEYAEIYIRRLKPQTAVGYRSRMKAIFGMYPSLQWADITVSWKYRVIEAMKAKGNSDNYISKLLATVKTIANAAIDEGITDIKLPSKLVPTPTPVDTIFIPHDDIMRMYRYDYPREYLTNAVRLWVLLYCTGQRVSDMAAVLSGMQLYVRDTRLVRFEQKKTGKIISLPFNDIMTELWAAPPRIISDQKLNKYIKEAATMAGIRHGDIISSHAARRSCATNLVLSGVPISIVMDITGHSTERECMRYVRYDDIAGAIRIGETEAFLQLFKSGS